MGLPQEFWDNQNENRTANKYTDSAYTGQNAYTGEFTNQDQVSEGFNIWDMLGEAAWHTLSSGTLGLSETVAPTKSWEEKSTSERMGASIGEAVGFFVPMGLIGKGIRGAKAAFGQGSKAIAKRAISDATSDISNAALQKAVRKGMSKTAFTTANKKLLYQHELGGEALERASKEFLTNVEAGLLSGIKKAGLKADDVFVADIMKGLDNGLRDGKHINNVSKWIEGYAGKVFGKNEWFAKYTGEVAQDIAVLGVQGIASNTIHSMARGDVEFDPASSLGHAMVMSAVFPAIRSFGTGGERRIGELWTMLRARTGKTNYDKIAKAADGPENIKGLLHIYTGGKYKNILGKTEWTSRISGKKYNVQDFNGLNFNSKNVLDDAVDLLKQMQSSIGKIDITKAFTSSYIKDTINASTITRMAVGAGAMNIDLFRDNMAAFRNLPPEELLTHLLLGGMMSRSRGGWAHDPRYGSAGAKAERVDDMFSLMRTMGIKTDNVSNYISVKNNRDLILKEFIGMGFDPTADQISRVYREYEKIANSPEAKKKYDRSKKEVNDPIEEWAIIRDAIGLSNNPDFSRADFNKLTPEQRNDFRAKLERIKYKDKTLKETTYHEFMMDFKVSQGESIKELYKSYLYKLKDEGLLNFFEDANGRINHGGIDYEVESNEVSQLYRLLHTLERNGLAQKVSNPELHPKVMYSQNNSLAPKLEVINNNFRKIQNKVGLGEGTEYYFNLGDVDSNPYLKTWVQSAHIQSEKRLGEMFTGKISKNNEADNIFRDTLVRELADDDGYILSPSRYRIVDKNNKEVNNIELESSMFGLINALKIGHSKTREIPAGKDLINIQESVAEQLVGQYESLNLTIRAEDLVRPEYSNHIKNHIYNRFDMNQHSIDIVTRLEENGLIVTDRNNKKILFNSDEAIREMVNKETPGANAEEYVRLYNEIKSYIPNNVSETVKGSIDLSLIPDQFTNISHLKVIHKMIPDIYNKRIQGEVEVLRANPDLKFNEDIAIGILENLDKKINSKKLDYKGALIELENLAKVLPQLKKTDGKKPSIYEDMQTAIMEAAKNEMTLEMRTFELSKGSGNVFDAFRNMVSDEAYAYERIEQFLTELVYRGTSDKHGAIVNHTRLIDNLNNAIKNKTNNVTIEQLFESYLANNSYKSLEELISGVNNTYVGRSSENRLSNEHLLDAYERFIQNNSDSPTISRITIGNKYGLLNPDNKIKPIIIERLKNGDFESIKKNINEDLHGPSLDKDLLVLSEMQRNTVEKMTLRLTERLIPQDDGSFKLGVFREWVPKFDNPEMLTPGNELILKLNDAGLPLFHIMKTGILGNKVQSDISSINSVKSIFENRAVDSVDPRYIYDTAQSGKQVTPRDHLKMSLIIPNVRDGGFRYIETGFGRPLAFVENTTTLNKLNPMYEKWFNDSINRYRDAIKRGEFTQQTLENFKQVFDPSLVKSSEEKIKALILSELNSSAFYKLWTPEAMNNFNVSGGHYDKALKMIKYNKLAEGGSLKQLPNEVVLQSYIDNLPNIGEENITSIKNIISDLKSKKIGTGFYNDEAEGSLNKLLIRNRVLDQINETTWSDPALAKYFKERISDPNRFKNTMDVSSIDGAIFIDKDMRNLFQTLFAAGNEVNGFKGSWAKGGTEGDYILYGKGLYIYDPSKAASMSQKGIRFLIGQSAAKGIEGLSQAGEAIIGRVSNNNSLSADILSMTKDNIINVDFSGIGLRFSGHLSNNAPVPHPWAHYTEKSEVIGIREGWQRLTEKIDQIQGFSKDISIGAHREVAEAIKRIRKQNPYEMNTESFAEMMLGLHFTTENPVVRDVVLKIWEEQTLPMLVKPKNPKFAYSFLVPDLKARNPISIDLIGGIHNDQIKGQVRLQYGEATLGADYAHTPIEGIDDLVFSFRYKDADFLTKYMGKGKYEIYNGLHEIQTSKDTKGLQTRVDLDLTKAEVPKSLKKLITHLEEIYSGKGVTKITDIDKTLKLHRYLESLSDTPEFKGILSDDIRLVLDMERGPRKGLSDFMPVKVRIRSKDERDQSIGTATALNALDVRANAQGDHDGDKIRGTHDFSSYKGDYAKWRLLKSHARWSSNQEEYPVLTPPIRQLNLFGISKDNMGNLTPAGSSTVNSLSQTRQTVSREQRGVGKIVGMQSSLEWMYLTGFKIDGEALGNKLGFDVKNMIENGNIYRRFEKGNQSGVDFIKGTHDLLKDPYSYMIYGTGEMDPNYQGRLFKHSENDIRREIVFEVVDVLKGPNAIFNQVYSEGVGKNATSYDIQAQYGRLRKFFSNPNAYIFRRLVQKYQRDPNLNLESKLNELIPLFYSTESGGVYPQNLAQFKSQVLKGNIRPQKNVIEFDNIGTSKLIRKSNVGFIMDESMKTNMFKSNELDRAYEHDPAFSGRKKSAELILEDITMYRLLGITNQDLIENATTVKIGGQKLKFLQNAEKAAMLSDILLNEAKFYEGKLAYQLGFKNGNSESIRSSADRLTNVSHALNIINEIRTREVIDKVNTNKSKYEKIISKGSGYINNKSSNHVHIYKVSKDVAPDGIPNFNSLSFITSIGKGQSAKVGRGKYYVLNNPIVGHRASREQTLDGYAWKYIFNSIPMFTDQQPFKQIYDIEAPRVSAILRGSWAEAINSFKQSKAFSYDVFNRAALKKRLALDTYFKLNPKVGSEYLIDGFTEKESATYYQAKLLLKPHILDRHYIKGDIEMPYLKLSDRVFKDVFSYLHETGQKNVAAKLASEYQHIKRYLQGYTNENTFNLNPSPLFLKKYNIPEGVSSDVFMSIMSGVMTPDVEIMLKSRGMVSPSEELIYGEKNAFGIRKIRNLFGKWQEGTQDHRRTCR